MSLSRELASDVAQQITELRRALEALGRGGSKFPNTNGGSVTLRYSAANFRTEISSNNGAVAGSMPVSGAWRQPTLQSGFTNYSLLGPDYSPSRFRRDGDVVTLDMILRTPTSGSTSGTVCQMPDDCKPTYQRLIAVMAGNGVDTGAVAGFAYVTKSGQLVQNTAFVNGTYLNLVGSYIIS